MVQKRNLGKRDMFLFDKCGTAYLNCAIVPRYKKTQNEEILINFLDIPKKRLIISLKNLRDSQIVFRNSKKILRISYIFLILSQKFSEMC